MGAEGQRSEIATWAEPESSCHAALTKLRERTDSYGRLGRWSSWGVLELSFSLGVLPLHSELFEGGNRNWSSNGGRDDGLLWHATLDHFGIFFGVSFCDYTFVSSLLLLFVGNEIDCAVFFVFISS